MIPDDKKNMPEILPSDEDRVYDLLVDGELDDDRRRALLGSLDDKPGGWRRCALAFLEAQSWGQEFRSLSARLGGMVQEATSIKADVSTATNRVAGKKTSAGGHRKKSRSGTILGLAASFLLAMGITSLMHDMNPSGGPSPFGNTTAGITPVPPTLGQTKDPQVGHIGVKSDETQEMQLFNITAKDSLGNERSFGLPAVSQKDLDQQWLKEMPTAIPDGVVESFQKAGHEVKTSRQLMPFTMPDGRKLIIPVDQVDVGYSTVPYFQ